MGNNPNQRRGRAVVKADGENLDLGEVTFTLPGVKREDINEGKGFTEADAGGSVKGKHYKKKGDSLKRINEMDDVTVVITEDTGRLIFARTPGTSNRRNHPKTAATLNFIMPKRRKS